MEEFPEAIDFLKSLKQEDIVTLFTDSDADGVTAGTIMSIFLEEKNIKHSLHFYGIARTKQDELIQQTISKETPTHLITCDMSLDDQTYKWLSDQGIKVLTADHHISKKDPKTNNHVYANFEKIENMTTPSASALVEYLTTEAGKKASTKWVSLVGAASDLCLFDSLEYIRLTKEEEDAYIPNKQLEHTLFTISETMSVTYIDPSLSPLFTEILKDAVKTNNIKLLILEKHGRAKKIFDTKIEAENETDTWTMKLIKGEAGKIYLDKKFAFLKMNKPKYNIKRWVVSTLRTMYPGYISCVAIDLGNAWGLSFRCGREYDLSKLIPKALEKIPNSKGGGHPRASGAIVPKDYLDKAIENFLALI